LARCISKQNSNDARRAADLQTEEGQELGSPQRREKLSDAKLS
jgi:hypothetical protein